MRARKFEEALVHLRKAAKLDPTKSIIFRNLGLVQNLNQNRTDEAIDSFRTAIKLNPEYAEAYCDLGHALDRIGHFEESLANLQRGHELGSKNPAWHYPSALWVEQARRKVALVARLPALLINESKPSGAVELDLLIEICRTKKQYYSAYRVLVQWNESHAPVAVTYSYEAACLATLAAASQGEDARQLDDLKRTELRQKAQQILRIELTRYASLVQNGSLVERELVQKRIRPWLINSDLNSIRDTAALAKLPVDEQKAFTQLWADVAALLKKAEEKAK